MAMAARHFVRAASSRHVVAGAFSRQVAYRRCFGATAALPAPVHLPTWVSENQASFAPPVMNKLMHRDQLSIMFVGGPNRREDFHLEEGSEFFFQLKGDMELPTVQAGRRVNVVIREGDVYLLPSRIPHSPQRPHEGSLGLVIERQRYEHEPPDGLRYYVDFATCDKVLWEKYFHCYDLGKDLVPVVQAFNASEEKRTRIPTPESVPKEPPLRQDETTVVPSPFRLADWLSANADALDRGEVLNLFEGHPDREFKVLVAGGGSKQQIAPWEHETWLYQLSGHADVTATSSGETVRLQEGSCLVVPAALELAVDRPAGSRGLVVRNDPSGNK
eukprot:TRINITY_DN4409_c0_g1_i1.p1 TRINITY_DN4409_c0_g1~~TRINITY_DN4409_c0_g1_i1.p1  ORF type:complete len:351 (+),score=70.62 TRINITY_DN4409_c0_g1_i1:62-1054(+)